MAAYQHVREAGGLHVRVTLTVVPDAPHSLDHHADDPVTLRLDLGLCSGIGDEYPRIGPIKTFADGALNGRTAAMHEPFHGEPDNRGRIQLPVAELRERVDRRHAAGRQIATHAIGDRTPGS